MRQTSAMRGPAHKINPSTDGSSTVIVAGLCVMLVLVLVFSFQFRSIGRDFVVRSAALTKSKATHRQRLQENRTLRKEKAFVSTEQGKEIFARRNYLYKRPNETYWVVDFQTHR